jgi:hypothetical protein
MSVLAQQNGVTYISSKDAAKRVGYTSDYIARLAREGKIVSRREGVQWLVELASLEMFLKAVEQAREERKAALREERRRERAHHATGVVAQSAAPQARVATGATARVSLTSVATASSTGALAVDDAFPSAIRAHALAAGSLVSGLALAVVLVYGSTAVPVSTQTASLMDSFMHLARATWNFALPWQTKELAQVPTGTEQDLTQRGIVVLPRDNEDARTVTQVQEAFSDDVIVRLDEDRTTGTIVPVFKDGVGDEYQFVIVPVAQPP